MSKINFYHLVKSEIIQNLSLSIPLIASQLIYASSSFIGTAMVARLGQNALAASVLVSMIWMTLSVFFFGILNAVSVLVAHQFGAKNDKAIGIIMDQSFILGIFVSIIIFFIMLSMPLFLHWSSQPPGVLNLAHSYMHALLWTIPALVLLIICEQFLAGIGRTKIVLLISFLVVPIEIPLIYIFVFGKLGSPVFGVAGIGYGFAVTYTMTAIGLIFYLLNGKQYKKYQLFSSLSPINFFYIKEFLRVGMPMGMMHLIEVSTFAIATFWIARFGTTLLAAHQIVFQYLGFAITIVFAMSQAVTVRVGHGVGRQDLLSVRYAAYVGMGLSFCCIGLLALLAYFFPMFFLKLDLNVNEPANAALIQDTLTLMSISCVLILFDNFRIIGFGALRGLKDTRFPMYASLISFWIVGLSAAFTFAFITHLGGRGIWWGLTFGIAFGAFVVFFRLGYILKRVNLAQLMGLYN